MGHPARHLTEGPESGRLQLTCAAHLELVRHAPERVPQHPEFRRPFLGRLDGEGLPPADEAGPLHQFADRSAQLSREVTGDPRASVDDDCAEEEQERGRGGAEVLGVRADLLGAGEDGVERRGVIREGPPFGPGESGGVEGLDQHPAAVP